MNHEVDGTAVTRVFDLGDILELVDDGLDNGTLPQQLVAQQHQLVLHVGFEVGDELVPLETQLVTQGFRQIAFVAKQLAICCRKKDHLKYRYP